MLLPRSEYALLARWQGPFRVIRQVKETNYEIELGRRHVVLHINLLKLFHERPKTEEHDEESGPPSVKSALIADECQDEAESIPIIDDSEGTEEWQIGSQLDSRQRAELLELLEEFQDRFGKKPGRTDLIEHVIRSTDEIPCRPRIYRVPESLKNQVKKQIQEMLELDLIQESETDFINPLVCVRKPDSSIRICVDLKAVNMKTIGDQFPASDMSTIIDKCAGAKFVSTMDLLMGFYQIPLSQDSQKYTAFPSDHDLYEFKVCPMGAKNSTKTFQRLVNRILHGAEEYAMSHVDDIAIFSQTWEDHLAYIRDVLTRLRQANLVAKSSKCHFAQPRLKCLGFIIEDEKISPDPKKVETIKSYPIPKKKQVRCFMGLTQFYRKHIENCSAKAAVLTDLTKKDKPDRVVWGEKENRAFEQLKNDLISAPVLISSIPGKGFILKTDACNSGIWAILCMEGDDKLEHPICYASKKLLPRQMAYSTVEKEALAVVFFLKYFEEYTFGKKVQIRTDHNCLRYLQDMQNTNPRLTRWALCIQRYDLEIVYVKASQHQDADTVSRVYMPSS